MQLQLRALQFVRRFPSMWRREPRCTVPVHKGVSAGTRGSWQSSPHPWWQSRRYRGTSHPAACVRHTPPPGQPPSSQETSASSTDRVGGGAHKLALLKSVLQRGRVLPAHATVAAVGAGTAGHHGILPAGSLTAPMRKGVPHHTLLTPRLLEQCWSPEPDSRKKA